MLPPASPFLVEEFERLERKIWESLIEADGRARYFARIPEEPGLWQRVLAAVGGRAEEPAAQLAALQARWSYESEALRDRRDDLEAKYGAFGGTLPEVEE